MIVRDDQLSSEIQLWHLDSQSSFSCTRIGKPPECITLQRYVSPVKLAGLMGGEIPQIIVQHERCDTIFVLRPNSDSINWAPDSVERQTPSTFLSSGTRSLETVERLGEVEEEDIFASPNDNDSSSSSESSSDEHKDAGKVVTPSRNAMRTQGASPSSQRRETGLTLLAISAVALAALGLFAALRQRLR